MKVLSLFDGISCGMVALERAGIKVDRYVAYEIDKYAIQVSEKNYPQIEHKGNVFDANFKEYKGFDLLIGGSPCTYWSIARNNREVTPDGIGGQLFMQYKRALDESGCKYFLYENNYSIHQNIKEFISTQLGVQPIMINSALVSAQNRKRCYWTNIPGVEQPKDRGIVVDDILIGGGEQYAVMPCEGNKAHTIVASYAKAAENPFSSYGSERARQRIAVKLNDENMKRIGEMNGTIRIGTIGKGGQGQRIYSVRGKSVTLSANGGGQGAKTGLYKIDLPDGDYIIRKLTPVEAERLQTLPDNYTAGISNTQRYKCIGNGWTVDVIAHILKHLKDEEEE